MSGPVLIWARVTTILIVVVGLILVIGLLVRFPIV